MAAPRVEVSGVWVRVFGFRCAVKVENEFIGGEEHVAVGALDALGPRAVVSRGHEAALAAPATVVHHVKGEVLGQFGRFDVFKERFDQSLRFPLGDHPAATGGNGHCACAAQDLELHGSALDARDAQRHPAVVDLVIAEPFEKGVGDLCETEPLFGVDMERDDGDAVKHDGPHVVLAHSVVRVGGLS